MAWEAAIWSEAAAARLTVVLLREILATSPGNSRDDPISTCRLTLGGAYFTMPFCFKKASATARGSS